MKPLLTEVLAAPQGFELEPFSRREREAGACWRNPEPGEGPQLIKTFRMVLAAPQGFEPRYADPESAVLPLNEGAARG